MPDQESIPIACNLRPADLHEREVAWRKLLSDSLVGKSVIANGVRLELDAQLETAHAALDLVNAERACCAWASWTLLHEDSHTVVEVTASDQGAQVLRSMFAMEQTSSGPTQSRASMRDRAESATGPVSDGYRMIFLPIARCP
jgi:hypothetical protein